jgi:hypothetical protein
VRGHAQDEAHPAPRVWEPARDEALVALTATEAQHDRD